MVKVESIEAINGYEGCRKIRPLVFAVETSHRNSGGYHTGKKLVCDCGNDKFYEVAAGLKLTFAGDVVLVQCSGCMNLYNLGIDYWQIVGAMPTSKLSLSIPPA